MNSSHRLSAPLLVTGLLAAACASVSSGHGVPGATPATQSTGSPGSAGASAWRVVRGARVTSTIVINVGDTFAPPPAGVKPKLDGVQAWDKSFLGRRDHGKPRPIPADLSYQLGLLTVPPSVTDVLAWGYSSPPGPCLTLGGPVRPARSAPVAAPATAPAKPRRCIQWTFINATNASNPDGTWQPLGTPSPAPAPTPSSVIALRSGGFLDASPQSYSPRRLVLQGPESTLRWTFDNSNCSIRLYWFLPPLSQRGPARPACPWKNAFSLEAASDFTSRGHVFSVIGGYVAHRMGDLVRAILANGQTQIYDAQNADGAWMIAVQRCGNYSGTAFKAVEEITPGGTVIARLPIPAASPPAQESGCRS